MDVVRALVALPRALRLYPAGHQRIESQLDELETHVAELLGTRRRPLRFAVRGIRVSADGEPLDLDAELASSFAFLLRRRGLEGVALKRGISRAELLLLAELLDTDEKKLFANGGAAAFLDREAHPCLEAMAYRTKTPGADAKGGEEAAAIPPLVLEALDHALRLPDVTARIEGLRDRLGQAGPEGEAFDRILREFLRRPEWSEVAPSEMARVLGALLDLLEEIAATRETSGPEEFRRQVDSLESFFDVFGPADLQSESVPAHLAPPGRKSVDGRDLWALAEELHEDTDTTTEAIRENLKRHPYEENALFIQCELMLTADRHDHYVERRQILLDTLAGGRYASGALARLLRFLALELPPTPFESRDVLIQAVFDATRDEEALVLFLTSVTGQAHAVRPILDRIVLRTNPFPLLLRMLCAPELASFGAILREKLVEAARLRREALVLWARSHRKQFLRPEIFDTLLAHGTEFLGAACKEILHDASARDRSRLIERLEAEGSDTALRLLVLGLSYGPDPCERRLLRALGTFAHPLAAAALREVVFRNNLHELHPEEAKTALDALCRIDLPEGGAFVSEVAYGRVALLPRFRWGLRRLARRILRSQKELA